MDEDDIKIEVRKTINFEDLCHALSGQYDVEDNTEICFIKRGPRSSLVMQKTDDIMLVFDPTRPYKRVAAKTDDDKFECRMGVDKDPYVGGGIGSDYIYLQCRSDEFALYTAMYATWRDIRKRLIAQRHKPIIVDMFIIKGMQVPDERLYTIEKEYYSISPEVADKLFESASKIFGIDYNKVRERFSKQERISRGWSNAGRLIIEFDERGRGTLKGLWYKGNYQVSGKF